MQGLSVPASSSLRSLVPPVASLSSSFRRQIHPSAFPSSSSSPPSFSSSPPSSSEKGPPLNMGRYWGRVWKDFGDEFKKRSDCLFVILLLFFFLLFL